MSQSFPKVQKKPAPERNFFKTCGRRRAINGKSYRAKINAAILAYLILEGSHTTDDIAATFFSFSRKDELSKYIGHLKNQLAKFGAEGCLVQDSGQLNVQAFDTDYRHLLEACKRRNIAAIKKLVQGKFLEDVKVEGAEAMRWIVERENERNEAIWQAFLHAVALGQIPPTSLETAFKLSSALPSSTSLCFIYLYDLLNEQRVSTTIKRRMLELLPLKERLDRDGLKTYVETRRDYFKHKGEWQSPLELWGDGHRLELLDIATDSNPAEVQRPHPRLFKPLLFIVGSLAALFAVIVGSAYLQQEAQAETGAVFYDDFERGLDDWQFAQDSFYLGEGKGKGHALCMNTNTHYHFIMRHTGQLQSKILALDLKVLDAPGDGSVNIVFGTFPDLSTIHLLDIFKSSAQIARQDSEGYDDYQKEGEFFYLDTVDLTNGKWHHLELRASESSLQLFLDGLAAPVVDMANKAMTNGDTIAFSLGGGWIACLDNVMVKNLS